MTIFKRDFAKAALATKLGAAVVAFVCMTSTAHAEWITTWASAQQQSPMAMGPIPASPSFKNRTIRQMLRVSAGGKTVRVRFTNALGARSLAIGGARMAMLDAGGQEIPGSSRVLTFNGAATAEAARGAPLLSDAVKLDVPALARVAISLYLPGETGPCTCHAQAMDDTEVSAAGNFVAAPFKPESVIRSNAFLAAVEVDAPAGSGTVVAIGDSITDGTGATFKANARWPDRLAERLAARPGRAWGVANQGIGGNRLLHDLIAESVLSRFDRDVLAVTGVKAVIVFIGVNDLGLGVSEGKSPGAQFNIAGQDINADQMLLGYRQLIERARSRNVKIYGATIAPYKGAGYWNPKGEAARQKINAFIRSGVFDGVIDFDKVLGSPADPLKWRDGWHSGDHLHGNDAGYKAMADSIDLRLFPR